MIPISYLYIVSLCVSVSCAPSSFDAELIRTATLLASLELQSGTSQQEWQRA